MSGNENSIHEWRLFNEFEFAEPPDWIPFLPKPGEFSHASYGKVAITPERNAQFVSNFKSGIYQTQLPIDAEHQTKLSGAMGWVRDMRLNEDGSADAKVEWTDRGKAMLTENRFKYFSPEFFETWTDPATNQQHQDVAIGGALTTRPFFKESSLRPLVASERGLFAADPVSPDTPVTTIFFNSLSEVQMETKDAAITPQQFSELHQQFNEVKGALAASEAKRAETEQEAKRFAEALDKSNARIALMEAADQRRRFAETCKDWFGKTEANVSLLVKMAEAFGEDSQEFKDFVISQNAIAAQLAESKLFSEIGTSRSADNAGTPGGKIEAIARQVATERKITIAQAMTIAAEQNPQLYAEYVNAQRGK